MYKHVKYKKAWYVMRTDRYEDFHDISRDSTNSTTIDPHKFSEAMITRTRKRLYVTLLTGSDYEYDIGIKREWIAFVEAVNEGMRIFQEDFDRLKKIKDWREKNK